MARTQPSITRVLWRLRRCYLCATINHQLPTSEHQTMPNRNGRKPKSSADKALRGNPGKRDLKVVELGQPLNKTAPPDHLQDHVKEIWSRFAPDLIESKLLTTTSAPMFEMFCEEFALYRRSAESMFGEPKFIEGENSRRYDNPVWKVHKQVRDSAFAIGLEFGLTPTALQRAGAAEKKSDDSPWQKFGGS